MVFSSLLFLFRFLPAVLILYYAAPRKLRNVILLLFSLFFYAWGEPKYVFLMLFTITLDFFIGRGIDRAKKAGNQKKAKGFLLVSIITDLSILGFFKYADFLIGTVNTLTGAGIPLLGIPLPIGISFFTFQTMSYTIDVYKGSTEVQKNWIKYGTYVSMFPQLIAGPIVQYKTIAKQMEVRRENTDDFAEGIHRFMIGLGKKVLIANNIGALWDAIEVLPVSGLAVGTAWLGAFAYTFQIYFDFAGYSDMAIGLGKMFGFHFLENFNYPYISKSITEFWRRWHISLSSWFKEYVYIPLGGNRHGVGRQILNLAIVWFLTGLWHGAYYNFILWGVYYGVLLVLEKFVLKKVLDKLPAAFGHIYTMLFVMIGWSLFSWQDMTDSANYMRAMFFRTGAGVVNQQTMYLLVSHAALLVIAVIGSLSVVKRFLICRAFPEDTARREIAAILFTIVLFIACVALLVNSSYNPFLYFRF